MKGFPNQIANFEKLSSVLNVISQLLDEGENPKDDKILGMRLVREGVLSTGHIPVPVESYIQEQLTKPPSYRSFETSARGLRELFRILGLIVQTDTEVRLTPVGTQIASFDGEPLNAEQLSVWRRVVINMTHDGNDGVESHPYQVLLRLISKRPGITRAKCALALEAKNDSEQELERIVRLSEENEEYICRTLGITRNNWNNAKKILPKFAEQLGDVRKIGQRFYITTSPGADVVLEEDGETGGSGRRRQVLRTRKTTAGKIGRAGIDSSFDEVEIPDKDGIDPETMAEAIRTRGQRLQKHNLIVREVAKYYEDNGAKLYEDPFDCFAVLTNDGFLVEVKTLDGTMPDEVKQVRDSLSQLLYYESFAINPEMGAKTIIKIACFDKKPSDSHITWLNSVNIQVAIATDDKITNLMPM